MSQQLKRRPLKCEEYFNSSTEKPLTQASFCKNIYAGVYYHDKKVRMLALEIILPKTDSGQVGPVVLKFLEWGKLIVDTGHAFRATQLSTASANAKYQEMLQACTECHRLANSGNNN